MTVMKFSTFFLFAFAAFPACITAFGVSDGSSNTINTFSRRDLNVSQILTDIEDALTCTACESLLLVLKVLAATGNENFVDVITTVCIAAGVEDDDVCKGSIGLEGPILAHDLREMTVGTRTSQLFCMTIFGLCQWPDIEAYSVSVSDKPATSRPSPSGESPIQIVHISDIHVDHSYDVGASYNCTKPLCCRPYTTIDEPGNTDYPAGPYGNSACDAPISLEESMYDAINSLVPDRKFTIFTGDIPEGAVWSITDDEVGNDINTAYAAMKSHDLGLVYGAVGNHESCPCNSFPPPTVDTTISSQWIYNNVSSDWETWIGATAAAEADSNFGCYSVIDSGSGLRIISINTNLWYKENFWMYESTMERDPAGLLAYLVTELEAAETAGERVWLIGHIPFGSSDIFHDQSQYLDQIIQRFDATIAATFFGHTHKDEFEIAYSDYNAQNAETATMVGYIAPALTPTSGNPSFRVYTVDPITFAILDYSTYYANLTSPTYQSGPTWELLYSVKETYGALLDPPVTNASAELTPAFWHNVTTLFENNDTVFQEYYSRKSRGYGNDTCDSDCKSTEICGLRALQSQYNCGTVTPGINFKRDAEATVVVRENNCDSSGIIPILTALGASGIDALTSALTAQLGAGFLNTTIPSNYTANGTS